MESKGLRRKQASATKQKIFDVAVRLIKAHGYAHVTVSQICTAAGLAKGSFYVHYNSKEDIVRESYYSDMNAYMERRYDAYLRDHPETSDQERIVAFLNFEMEFVDYAGYELTCLAYALNISACIAGPSTHFSKRFFSRTLYELIDRNRAGLTRALSVEDTFHYLESLVRGIMATWCFSDHCYDIKEAGQKQIAFAVQSVFTP